MKYGDLFDAFGKEKGMVAQLVATMCAIGGLMALGYLGRKLLTTYYQAAQRRRETMECFACEPGQVCEISPDPREEKLKFLNTAFRMYCEQEFLRYRESYLTMVRQHAAKSGSSLPRLRKPNL